MIKFRIFSKIWEGKRCKFGEVLKNCQSYRFFYIFWDILGKRKGVFGQECVKGRLLSFQGKIATVAPDLSGKMTVFPVLTLLFHLLKASIDLIVSNFPIGKCC